MSIRIVANVVARYLAAAEEANLRKFQQLKAKALKEMGTLAGLYKTYDRQAHGYRTQNLEKAQVTREKIGDKIKAIRTYFGQALDLAKPVLKLEPKSEYKKRIYDDFKGWIGKYEDALARYDRAVDHSLSGPGTSPPLTFTWGLDGGFVPPGQNPMHDLHMATGGVEPYWVMLLKPEKDPLSIPKDGTDEERFMAFLTPDVKRLAKSTASKIKKDKSKAAILAWRVLEDVNAHTAASTAESLLHPLVEGEENVQDIIKIVSGISGSGPIDYGIVEAGVFGVALMQEVGEKAYADRLAKALAKEFAEYTTGEVTE